MNRPSVLRLAIAIGCVLIGAIHLRLYFDSYRDIPIENVGRSFVLNAVAAGVAAVVVLVWPSRLALLGPLVLANATLVAFALEPHRPRHLRVHRARLEPDTRRRALGGDRDRYRAARRRRSRPRIRSSRRICRTACSAGIPVTPPPPWVADPAW